jgi:hypothetical protein
MPCGDQVTQQALRAFGTAAKCFHMALFFPSMTPTRRKRWQMPWAALAGIISAALSVWMISQVYVLHKQRHEKKLEEMFAPQREQLQPPPARANESPRLTLAVPARPER